MVYGVGCRVYGVECIGMGNFGDPAETTTMLGLFLIPIFIVNADEGTGEGEDFAEGDED